MIKTKAKDKKIKKHTSLDDKILYTVSTAFLLFVLIVVAYPIIFVVSSSLSSGKAVSSGRVLLWPVEFSLQGYRAVFNYKSVWIGFRNSIFYTVVGTALNMFLSVLAAYPLSRPNYQGRRFGTILLTITMLFSAGIIPKYLLMSDLHLVNNMAALIFITPLHAYYVIIMLTYFRSSIPNELIEAARIDGCSEIRTLFSVVLPLSHAVLSVVTLFYAVGHWNSYFNAMIYLRKQEQFPLQLILRNILSASEIDLTQMDDPELLKQMIGLSDLMKYSLIVITSVPVIVAYPFVQKFFKRGVMIGSVKG